ncbi:hypothetical protein SLW70_05395 [Flavobacterium sp. NG2]|uniref:hypothetical protein n=1 Tax=Flavobacterium sp. NG2 TaxID=3097547 RepID=UPI002A834EBC|nr:hypothetical protein [Flavobacterium sp. NG2]WPR72572.1 hypothetical protein SLW70_05395 [Flavobacterium sp. NG2]
MILKRFTSRIKWLIFALIISFVLVSSFDGAVFRSSSMLLTQNTFLGLNLFLEILIFFVFSIFVVFGIKGYFEMYSQKTSNVIIFITGAILTFVIFILSCQILL